MSGNRKGFTSQDVKLICSGKWTAYQLSQMMGRDYRSIIRYAYENGVDLPKKALTIRENVSRTHIVGRRASAPAESSPDECPGPEEDDLRIIMWKPRHGRSALGYGGDDLVPISIPRIKCIHGEFRERRGRPQARGKADAPG